MAILLLPAGPATPTPESPSLGTARLRILLSPLRGRDSHLRFLDEDIPAGRTVADSLPSGGTWARVIHGGRVLTPEDQESTILVDGDELLLFPSWGADWLIYAGVSLALTLISMGVNKFLLTPSISPAMQGSFEQDEQTYSFNGIKTATGPGAIVPVVYGKHRVGGQLLSASIEQAVTEVHGGQQIGINTIQAQGQSPALTMLLALSEGPIASIITDSIEINGQPISNFPGVQTFTLMGTADQQPLGLFGETRNTWSDAREIPAGGIVYTTSVPVTAFVLNIAFQDGLYFLSATGEKQGNMVRIGYRFRVNNPQGAWTGYYQTIVYGERTTAVRVGLRQEELGLAVYDIEVALQYVGIDDEDRARWKPSLESVTECEPTEEAFPYTALLGIRALATDQLQGALPNITVEIWGRTVREGSFAAAETTSQNPAWCVMDLLTNTRYGYGYPDAQIDLGSFLAWAAYCNEQIGGETRHVLNYVLDREVRGQPLLLEICGGSRTLLLKSEGQWHARPTRNDAPIQLLNAANVSNLRLTYARDTDRVNVLEARFANEDMKYAQDVQTWPALAEWPAVVRKSSVEIRGVTKPSRIQRELQFELNRRRLEVLSIEFEAALDALVLQPHDVFRFSHPLPGWGACGRLEAGSTQSTLYLDQDVTFVLGQTYHVYVRYPDHGGLTEVRAVVNTGGTRRSLTLSGGALPYGITTPRQTLWAFGPASPESAVKLFRVVKMERTGEQTIRLQAILHNGAIYDEPVAQALPVTTQLFNPLGPPPPLLRLMAMEFVRIQSSGASMQVVNLSWDVAPLSAGYAPYGGAQIYRRQVEANALAGVAQAGVVAMGTSQASNDGTMNFVPLARVGGMVMDLDDYTVMPGLTYVYRVVPVSGRGVPNVAGALEAVIHVAGPTTGLFFPGTPLNLRLAGQAVGVTEFDGPDIHLEWDAVASSPLFTSTFFVQDYILEAWAPGQAYLLRRVTVATTPLGVSVRFTYTLGMNAEDHVRAGQPGAQRTILFQVSARTNTGRVSITPATLQVTNPAPDMSMIQPDVTALFEAALIEWTQWVEPRDFDHYVIYLDTVNPPQAIYQDVPGNFQKIGPMGLTPNVAYYVRILPYDTFGPGMVSATSTFTPVALSGGQLDTTPPSTPTGLALYTGIALAPDGTAQVWVEVHWTASPEPDVRGYEIQIRTPLVSVPSVRLVGPSPTSTRFENVPGNTQVFVKVAAFDQVRNTSAFTAEATITTGVDIGAPGVPTPVTAHGTFKAIALLWAPPGDLDYLHSEVWSSLVNNRLTATKVGEAYSYFVHQGMGSLETRYYWLRSVDSSGNMSAFVPGDLAGWSATTTQTSSADIGNLTIDVTKIADDSISTPKLQANSVDANKITTGELITLGAQIKSGIIEDAHITTLSANKIASGTIQATTSIHVGAQQGNAVVEINGLQRYIVVRDANDTARAIFGQNGPLSTDYGILVYNAAGQLMFSAMDGGVTAVGIKAGVIEAGHTNTNTLLVTGVAQIAAGLIDYVHINDAAIRTGHIADAQITEAKIQNLAVTDGKIQNLTANKITTGTITGQVIYLGGGSGASAFYLSGDAQQLAMHDASGQWRVILGRQYRDAPDYGLWIRNAAGLMMWELSSGATTNGITDAAVSTPKVATNAITETVAFFQQTRPDIVNTAVPLGGVTFQNLLAGDQILLWGMADCDGTNAVQTALYITLGAQVLSSTNQTTGARVPMAVQYVYLVTAPQISLTFTLWSNSNGTSTLRDMTLTGLLRKR